MQLNQNKKKQIILEHCQDLQQAKLVCNFIKQIFCLILI